MHEHPCSETFVIHRGRARFTVGERELVGTAGEVLVVPAYTPHKSSVLEGGVFESTNIHASDTVVTTWLEGPQAPTRSPCDARRRSFGWRSPATDEQPADRRRAPRRRRGALRELVERVSASASPGARRSACARPPCRVP
ncbi:cupin domain-containing protein [Georgenia yuyongxinii]|uniref:Cupin domain-containing protein n=1 Tax=Georgenia yuyongxinii TaxID=2589797 RepID=A0A5B8CAP9_9MICO|nr:cupin domain-containing protein [Georgenia yuyongxinii]